MKMKKVIILAVAVLLLAHMAGCKKGAQDSPMQGPEDTKQEAGLKYGEITDPAELEALWQEYLFDSANLVGISRDFSCAEEIDPLYVAQFCWSKYINEHDAMSLEPDHESSYLRLFPLDIVLEYAKRYFDLDDLDVSQIDAGNYDPQRSAFLFSPDRGKQPPRPSYNNSFRGKRLDMAVRNSDGTITAVLVRPDSQNLDRIEYTETYTLKQREDGSLYFASGRREYVNNHLVTLTGDYRRFDKITGFDGNPDGLSMLG